MENILKISLLGLFFGTFGTTIGGILGSVFEIRSNKILSFILEFAAGLMISVICFDLIPESLKIADMSSSLFGILMGVVVMMVCDSRVKALDKSISSKKNNLLRTGIIIGIGLALHNIPEGLAIGSGFDSSLKLGYSIAIAIAFHDVPEGISMAVPMKNGGMKTGKVIFCVFLSGVATGIGAFIGKLLGTVSENIIAVCLAFASGAMLYIVSGEIIPESKKLYQGRFSVIGNIIGFLMGFLVMNI